MEEIIKDFIIRLLSSSNLWLFLVSPIFTMLHKLAEGEVRKNNGTNYSIFKKYDFLSYYYAHTILLLLALILLIVDVVSHFNQSDFLWTILPRIVLFLFGLYAVYSYLLCELYKKYEEFKHHNNPFKTVRHLASWGRIFILWALVFLDVFAPLGINFA